MPDGGVGHEYEEVEELEQETEEMEEGAATYANMALSASGQQVPARPLFPPVTPSGLFQRRYGPYRDLMEVSIIGTFHESWL